MTKPPLISPDPLVMKVRKALKRIEPRPEPTRVRRNQWGHTEAQCPVCELWVMNKAGSYAHHWTVLHGTPFWREKMLIALLKRELKNG